MKIYFESYGCTLNKSESGLYVNKLLQEGGELVNTPEEADLSVISTCVVIKHTENKMLNRIQDLSLKSRVRVMGCLPPVSAGTLEGGNIETLKPLETRSFYSGDLDGIDLREPSIFDGIPINQGCTGSCNFCISRVARGKLLSRNPEKIVEQVRMQLARGIGEVRISSLDTAAYGKDISFRLPGLVNRITSLQGNFRLRVGMMEPKNTFEILDDLIDAYSSSRVFKFLHLPVQSGDDRILDSMNREYDAGTFYKIVEAYRRNFPDSTLSTDIISGYPGDDEESFENTLRLIERTRPEVINITRFSPRQFTRDFERKTPESNLVKRWTSEYSKLHRSLTSSIFQSHIGSLKEIFTTERVKEGTTLGRDSAYRPVVLPGNLPLYSTFEAEIVDSTDNYLIGKTIN